MGLGDRPASSAYCLALIRLPIHHQRQSIHNLRFGTINQRLSKRYQRATVTLAVVPFITSALALSTNA